MYEKGSVLVYRSGAVGDVIVAFPVLEVLRTRRLAAEIVLVAPSEVGELAVISGWADRLGSPDSAWVRGWLSGDADQVRVALAGVETLVAFTNDPDGELERTAHRAGIGHVLIHPPFPAPGTSVHVTDHLLSALDTLGIVKRGCAPSVRPSPAMIASARAELRDAGVDPDAPFLVVHTGSSAAWKNWPDLPRFAAFLRQRLGMPVVLQRGPVEVERGLGSHWPDAPIIGPLPLGTLAGILSQAFAYVGNDAGPSHLAAAVGAPTVTVFGRRPDGLTDAPQWSPRGPRARACAPDELDTWPTADAVHAALSAVIRGTPLSP